MEAIEEFEHFKNEPRHLRIAFSKLKKAAHANEKSD
jgi:hypothetical protein